MTKRIAMPVSLCCLLAVSAFAQRAGPKTLTANLQCASIGVSSGTSSTVTISVTGTWSATIQPEVIVAGQSPVNTSVYPTGSTTSQNTITANGVYSAPVAGVDTFQVCTTAYTSGTATIYFNVSTGVTKSGGGGGGGSGTVTSVGTGAGLTGGPVTSSGTLSLLAALPSNETATTQATGDNTTSVATDAFVLANGGTITKNYESAGNASSIAAPFFFGYNTLPDTGADRCLVWANAIAATVNGVTAFTVDARPEIAANIACSTNSVTGTTGGRLLLPPGTINALVGQQMPANANGLHVLGEGNSGVTTIKACASGHNGCGADMTLNGAGAVTAVIGMGPTTPASGQDVVGSSFERMQIDANGVAGVMGAAVTAGQEMTEFQHVNFRNSALVQFDIGGLGTNSVQNGVDLHDFYMIMNPAQAVYNPCPTAVTATISTISNTTGGVATVTLSGAPTPPLVQFGTVNITGQTAGGTHGTVYNAPIAIIQSVISSTSFTYTVASGGLADSATGNGMVQVGPIGIRYYTSPNGGGRPIQNGTIVAAGCNSSGTNPLAQLTASGGPLWAGHLHIEDALYGVVIGADGNTKDITLDHVSPVTNVVNGALISNKWTTTNIDINHLVTTQGGGTPNTTSLIDQINSNTLTPANNGHLPHYYLDSAAYPWTTANPVSGTEIANGFDFYNGTFAIYNGGTAKFSATNAGAVTATGGVVDFTGSTIFKARVGAALTTSASGDLGYDTTNKLWHGFANGVDAYLFGGPVSGTYTNNDCVKFGVASGYISLVDAGAACGTGSSGLSGMTAGGVPIAATATTITSSTTPGTNQGTYLIGHTNTVNGTATTLTEIQQGDCSGGGSTVSGTATYTVLYSDVTCTITHDIADTTAVTVTIPTPTTLHNSNPIFVWENHSNQTDVLTPTTFTISLGHTAAASTLNVPSNVACRVSLDPKNASTWKADCHPITTSASGSGTVTSIATTSPITGGTITTTGTIACATCVTSAAALTNNAVVIGGGLQASSTISADTTTTHALFATAGAPAFRAIATGDLPTAIPIGNVGSAGLSGTSPVTIASTGVIACATCVTSAAALTSNQAVNGNGSQASVTGFTDTAGTITSGKLACYTASNTIGNCTGTPSNNIIGVFNSSTTWIASGETSVALDATVNVTFGDILCASSSAGVAHDNGSTSCASGEWVGIVKTTASSVSSATAFVALR